MAGPDEGYNAGQADFTVRTVGEDNYWDQVGLTASRGAVDGLVDDAEPPGMGDDMDDLMRRPTWMPEG